MRHCLNVKNHLVLQSTKRLSRIGDSNESTVLCHGGKLLLQMTMTRSRAGTVHMEIRFGSEFRDIRTAEMMSKGMRITGVIDGRRLAPFSPNTAPKHVKYADGRPAPLVKLPRRTGEALMNLLTHARGQVKPCVRSGTTANFSLPITRSEATQVLAGPAAPGTCVQ